MLFAAQISIEGVQVHPLPSMMLISIDMNNEHRIHILHVMPSLNRSSVAWTETCTLNSLIKLQLRPRPFDYLIHTKYYREYAKGGAIRPFLNLQKFSSLTN